MEPVEEEQDIKPDIKPVVRRMATQRLGGKRTAQEIHRPGQR